MDFFNHVEKLYKKKGLPNLDIPLALFMIELLSIKEDFSNFKDENKFNEYMNSHKPLKLRYYLQVTFRKEMIEATEELIKKREKEHKNIEVCFGYKRNPLGQIIFNIPPYEKRIEIYEKYLKDIDVDEEDKTKISNWNNPDMINRYTNSDILNIIYIRINKKYGNPEHTKSKIMNFMNRFSDENTVHKLLYSIRDVYILGLNS